MILDVSNGALLPNTIHLGDCLELMSRIEAETIDCIICDLPYSITRTVLDYPIDLKWLWEHYERIIKPEGAIVLTASQPFTSLLVCSNLKMFRYAMVWEKSRGSNFVHSKHQCLKVHEDILIFSKSPVAYNKKHSMKYYPQMTEGKPYNKGEVVNDWSPLQGQYKPFSGENKSGKRYPRSVVYFSFDSDGKERGLHPTQKPVDLFSYLIKTYTLSGDIVLDNCMGSGTTAIACIKNDRKYIGIEQSEKYYNIINDRIERHKQNII